MKNMDILQILQTIFTGFTVVIAIVAVILAYKVGQKQNEINSRLLQMQDYVAISVTPKGDSIALWNTGNSNLYMWGFDMPGNNQRFDKPRLISKSEVAHYWIPAPNLGKLASTTNFDFRLYLTDEHDSKWVSENGGEASPTKITKEDKEVDALIIKVWAHKTTKTNWSLEDTARDTIEPESENN